VLEVLREPIESGVIHISRAARQSSFPAQFQLVAAMNPCPCGWLGDIRGRCRCTPDRIARYRARVSGPLLDRIDLALDVPSLAAESLAMRVPAANAASSEHQPASVPGNGNVKSEVERSATVRARVVAARAIQHERQGKPNARLSPPEVAQHCLPDAAGEAMLAQAMRRLAFSARAYHRILKVARTIADLAGSATIAPRHLAEAIGYRTGEAGHQ
jgi:magnesium chelatase family protein